METNTQTLEMITAEDVSLDAMMADFLDFEAARHLFRCKDESPDLKSEPESEPEPKTTLNQRLKSDTKSPFEKGQSIYVRLEDLNLIIDGVADTYRYNKRSMSWYVENQGRRINVDVQWMFEAPSSLMEIVVRESGVGYTAVLVWNYVHEYFSGLSVDGMEICIALEEMRSMVQNPWARQFKGYKY
ncbi:hypothetical protein BD289DRAFT_487155 [Coniella lustricola]|uniref:Uncharacterized protein n=1 Tax=Coniella lustricola TaxID=2025994 RepID=A0A2T2ZSR3_9PEZI|nr:hypothetical protein BD289DRAFT_487155 [Coniella lustricola]